jgi:hypothetical protein
VSHQLVWPNFSDPHPGAKFLLSSSNIFERRLTFRTPPPASRREYHMTKGFKDHQIRCSNTGDLRNGSSIIVQDHAVSIDFSL